MRQHFITRVLYLKVKIVGGRYFQNNNRGKNCITYIVALEGFSLPTLHSAVSIAMIFFFFFVIPLLYLFKSFLIPSGRSF